MPVPESFTKVEPKHSEAAHGHEAWDPDWIEYRFSFKCICSLKTCGEVAFVSGSGSLDQRYDYDGNAEYYDYFRIRSFHPAPYLIAIPDSAPEMVIEMLERSFSLYWPDTSAAANALRTSLEYLLDALKIPRDQKGKDKKTNRISLHARIELAVNQQPAFSELFLALKDVGNLGSHGDDVTDAHFSDALEIFSHVLVQLYENDAERIKELAKKLRGSVREKAAK